MDVDDVDLGLLVSSFEHAANTVVVAKIMESAVPTVFICFFIDIPLMIAYS
ncbi:hypothetical protein D3C86_2265090 [compost metagenome]